MAIGTPTGGALGVDLTQVITATGTSSNQGNQFALGTTQMTTDGQKYVYCLLTSPVSIYHWVGIDENFEASPLNAGSADAGHMIGVMQSSGSVDNSFMWVAVQGANLLGRCAAGCQPDVALFTAFGATGLLDDASVTAEQRIEGVVAIGAATVSASAIEVMLSYPHVQLER